MKVTQGEVQERQVALRIELDDDDLEPYVDRGYRQVVQKIRIPGFRPGKAPRKVVEGMVGREGLVSESMDFLVADVIVKAVESQEIDSVGFPKVDNVELSPVVVDATVALNPVLDLGDYWSIRVEDDPVEVTDEDVDNELESIRKRYRSWEPVERPVSFDDLVTMTVTGTIDGVEVLSETDGEYVVQSDSAFPFPGFAAALEGLRADEPANFTLSLPNDYADKEIAGKDVEVSVVLTGIKESILPDLDDEFARSISDGDLGYDTLDQLRARLQTDIETHAARQNEQEYRELVIEEFTVNADIEIAPILVEREVERSQERRDEMMERLQISADDYYRFTGKSTEQVLDEMREEAVNKLNRSHAIAALIDAESIEVEDADLEERLKQLAREGDESGQKLTNKQLRSEQVRQSVRETLLVKKAVDLLVEVGKGLRDGEGEERSSSDAESRDAAVQSTSAAPAPVERDV